MNTECGCNHSGGRMATGKGNQSVEEVKATTGALEISPSKTDGSSPVYGTHRSGGTPDAAAGSVKGGKKGY